MDTDSNIPATLHRHVWPVSRAFHHQSISSHTENDLVCPTYLSKTICFSTHPVYFCVRRSPDRPDWGSHPILVSSCFLFLSLIFAFLTRLYGDSGTTPDALGRRSPCGMPHSISSGGLCALHRQSSCASFLDSRPGDRNIEAAAKRPWPSLSK
jgi:hypothetical protein